MNQTTTSINKQNKSKKTSNSLKNQFYVFYDGNCAICNREISWLKSKELKNNKLNKQKQSDKINWIDISSDSFKKKQYPVSIESFQAQIHVYNYTEFITAMAALRLIYSKVGMNYVLGWTKLPIFSSLSDIGYNIFAKNRTKISKVFGLFVKDNHLECHSSCDIKKSKKSQKS